MHPRPNAVMEIEDLHPDALLTVVTDISRGELAFTHGNEVRSHWESPHFQRLSPWSLLQIPSHHVLIHCPDDTHLMAIFNSEVRRLGDEPTLPAAKNPKHKKHHANSKGR